MLRALPALGLVAVLSACGVDKTWAPDDQVAAARYVAGPPPSVTLFTVINDRNGTGAHSGLMINASQRVLFDPAGTWELPGIPIRNDVHFGITDRVLNFYRDYHARDSETEKLHIIERTVIVSPEVAELVLQRVLNYGAVGKAMCTNATSSVLSGLPGFESLRHTFSPKKLSKEFGNLPGVTTRVITDDDDDNNHGILLVQHDGSPLE